MERIPKPGEIYRHFKNKLYQVITVAHHTETGEELVIYQALYGTYGVYACSLAGFLGKVDKEKYPDAAQVFRFERLEAPWPAGEGQEMSDMPDGQEASGKPAGREMPHRHDGQEAPGKPGGAQGQGRGLAMEEPNQGRKLNPLILSFVDTKDFDVKLEILSAMEDKAGQEDMDVLCEAMDLPKREGDIGEQVRFIRQYLEMRKKFDSTRLR